ncbi:hypothetical protein I5907_19520 [Panacibacter sp. DH6]|uniref:Uncharacterized protein n=1 Tax=Panacibacter microcysteis TaxID=2793269 RepID=A0A931GZV9_9BACT|nr:hypothetical protein [Panacibacter microcysteis]MBG9378435.1 hypothetical protein [Panacibacter microcysteis]
MDKKEITAKDGNQYYYTISYANAENPLGIVKATLQEYAIYKSDNDELIGKLYRTKEGNWYDMPENTSINPLLKTFIKIAIEETEKKKTVAAEGEGHELV